MKDKETLPFSGKQILSSAGAFLLYLHLQFTMEEGGTNLDLFIHIVLIAALVFYAMLSQYKIKWN